MVAYDVRYTFHPVGQGLFASGCLNSHNYFNWVYDCGSRSKNSAKILKGAITEYQNYKFDEINLLAISHFDDDHINGLPQLLVGKTIQYLLLPYLNLEERVLVLLDSVIRDDANNTADDAIINTALFLHSPATFFMSFDGLGALQNIIYVSSGAPPVNDNLKNSQSDENLMNNRLDDNHLIIENRTPLESDDSWNTTNKNASATTIHKVPNGQMLYISHHIWEFIPYNNMRIVEIKSISKIFAKNIQEKVRDFLGKPTATKKDAQAIIGEIKEGYRSIRNGPNRVGAKQILPNKQTSARSDREYQNAISLSLFAGLPPTRTHLCECFAECCWGYRRCIGCYKGRHGIMYTGDSSLKNPNDMETFCDFYKKYLDGICVFQVMHHGSKNNFCQGIAQKIDPCFSVFSADPEFHPYEHPHHETIIEFMRNNPVLVNDKILDISLRFSYQPKRT